MGKYKELAWYERDKAGEKNLLVMAKAEAVKKLSTLISEAFTNDDLEAIPLYLETIEQQLQAMLKLVHEIREIIEKKRGENDGK